MSGTSDLDDGHLGRPEIIYAVQSSGKARPLWTATFMNTCSCGDTRVQVRANSTSLATLDAILQELTMKLLQHSGVDHSIFARSKKRTKREDQPQQLSQTEQQQLQSQIASLQKQLAQERAKTNELSEENKKLTQSNRSYRSAATLRVQKEAATFGGAATPFTNTGRKSEALTMMERTLTRACFVEGTSNASCARRSDLLIAFFRAQAKTIDDDKRDLLVDAFASEEMREKSQVGKLCA